MNTEEKKPTEKPAETTAVAMASTDATQVPAYLQNHEGPTGLEQLHKFIKPPRLKIVQKQASDELLERFAIGDIISTPSQELVVNKGEPLLVAPIFFWAEWCTWNPYALKDSMDTIAFRTTDENDPLVSKCRNPNMRTEEYKVGGQVQLDGKGAPHMLSHCEHLNYLFEVLSGPQAGLTCIASFFKAQHQDGTNFNQLIKMRKTPLYATQFEFRSYQKKYGGNTWMGMRASNPQTGAPFASEKEFAQRKELHLEMAEAHSKGEIVVDHDEPQDSNVVDGAKTDTTENAKF